MNEPTRQPADGAGPRPAIPLRPADRLDNDPFKVAIDAAERLRRALDAHGLVIPSLRGSYPVHGTPFVELGGCRADVADAIAALLEKAAER